MEQMKTEGKQKARIDWLNIVSLFHKSYSHNYNDNF